MPLDYGSIDDKLEILRLLDSIGVDEADIAYLGLETSSEDCHNG